MPANDFTIAVTAVDKTSAVFAKVDKAIAKFDAPIKKVNTGLSELANPARFDNIEKAFTGIGSSVGSLSDKVFGLIPGVGALAGIGSAGGILAIGTNFAASGANIERTAKVIGIGTDELQRLRGAAKLAGLPVEALDGALSSLGDTLENARWHRDHEAVLMLRDMKIKLPGPDELLDVRAMLDEIANALPANTPQVQRLIAAKFGLGGILPLLNEGAARVQEFERRVDAAGGVMGGKALDKATKLQESLTELGTAAEGTANAIGAVLAPAMEAGADATAAWLTNLTRVITALQKLPASEVRKPEVRRAMVAATTGINLNRTTTPGLSLFAEGLFGAFDMGQDIGKRLMGFTKTPVPTTLTPTPFSGGDAWTREKRIGDMTPEEFRAIGRTSGVAASDASGVLHIRLYPPAGMKTITQQQTGPNVNLHVEQFVPTDGP